MRFQVRAGSKAGTSFEVDRNGVVIGRGADCNLVIDDNKASRRHARIQQLPDGRIAVQDLGSSNGTLVNGSPIQSVILDAGGTIQIGDTVIDAVPATAPAAAAPGQPFATPPIPQPGKQPVAFGAPSPQQVGPRGERLSRV
jgi:pSer/pThr/pTyr-binding forkhead associated (FHA) protein